MYMDYNIMPHSIDLRIILRRCKMKKSSKKWLTFAMATLFVGAGIGAAVMFNGYDANTTASAAGFVPGDDYLNSTTTMKVSNIVAKSFYTNVEINFGRQINDTPTYLNTNAFLVKSSQDIKNLIEIKSKDAENWETLASLIEKGVATATMNKDNVSLNVDREYIPALALMVRINAFTVDFAGDSYQLTQPITYTVTMQDSVVVAGSNHLVMKKGEIKEQDGEISFASTEMLAQQGEYSVFQLTLDQKLPLEYGIDTNLQSNLLYLNDYISISRNKDQNGNQAEETLATISADPAKYGDAYAEISVENGVSYVTLYVDNSFGNINNLNTEIAENVFVWDFDFYLEKGFGYVDAKGNVCRTAERQTIDVQGSTPYWECGEIVLTETVVPEDRRDPVAHVGAYHAAIALPENIENILKGSSAHSMALENIALQTTSYAGENAVGETKSESLAALNKKFADGVNLSVSTQDGQYYLDVVISEEVRAYLGNVDIALQFCEDAKLYVQGENNANRCWDIVETSVLLKKAEYKVTYRTDSVDTKTYTITQEWGTELENATPKKRGYTFKGWLRDGRPAPTVVPTTDMVFDAVWEMNTYVVSVNLVGRLDADNAAMGDVTLAELSFNVLTEEAAFDALKNLMAARAAEADLSQYDFENGDEWYSYAWEVEFNAENVGKVIDKATQDEDGAWVYAFNLVATKQTYTVTFDYCGKVDNENVTVTAQWGTKLGAITALKDNFPVIPEREHYETVEGMSYWADAEGNRYDAASRIPTDASLTLHLNATWTPIVYTATVSYTPDGATEPSETHVIEFAIEAYENAVLPEEALIALNEKLQAYAAVDAHLYDYTACEILETLELKNYVFEVVQTRKQFTIEFYVGEKLHGMYNGAWGNAIDYPAEPTKAGYTFQGWFDENGVEYNEESLMPQEELTKVYADFDANLYTAAIVIEGKVNENDEPVSDTLIEVKFADDLSELADDVNAILIGDVLETLLAVLNEDGIIDNDAEYTYAWDAEKMLTAETDIGYSDYTFVINATKKTYKVEIYNDEEKLAEYENPWGKEIMLPDAVSKEGYDFEGWQDVYAPHQDVFGPNSPYYTPAYDAVIKAKWKLHVYTATIKNLKEVDGKYVYSQESESVVKVQYTVLTAEELTALIAKLEEENNVSELERLGKTVSREKMEEVLYMTYLPEATQETTYYYEGYWNNERTGESLYPHLTLLKDGVFPLSDTYSLAVASQASTKYVLTRELQQKLHEGIETFPGGQVQLGKLHAEEGKDFRGWKISYKKGSLNIWYEAIPVDGTVNEWVITDYNGNIVESASLNMPAADLDVSAIWNIYPNVVKVTLLDGTVETVYFGVEDGEWVFVNENGKEEKYEVHSVERLVNYLEATYLPQDTAIYSYGWAERLPYFEYRKNASDPIVTYEIAVKQTPIEYSVYFLYVDNGEVYREMKGIVGAEITAPAAPTKVGYTFQGWVYENGDALEGIVSVPAGGVTLYADWAINYYNFTIIGCDGTLLQETQETVLTLSDTVYVNALMAQVRPNDTAEYTYTWIEPVPTTFEAKAYTFTLKCTPVQYTVTMVNAEGATLTQTVAFGKALDLETPPSVTGKTFGGWVLADGSKAPSTMPAKDLAVYADWQLDVYTVTVKMYDGSVKEIKFAMEEDVEAGVLTREQALETVKALLPLSTEDYTYTWKETLPITLTLSDYDFEIVETEVEYGLFEKIGRFFKRTFNRMFSGCGSVVGGAVGCVTALGVAVVALVSKKRR